MRGFCFLVITFAFATGGWVNSAAVEAATPLDPADLLFEAFASKCSSQGNFTGKALSETLALEGLVTNLMRDDACKGLTPVLEKVTTLRAQLSFLNNGGEGDREHEME